MNRICTTIEQSQKLIELGLDPSTADMCYNKINTEDFEYHLHVGGLPKIQASYVEYIPAWSLTALLELMPNATLMLKDYENVNESMYCFCIVKHQEFISNSPLNAAFEMVCWLRENGKI